MYSSHCGIGNLKAASSISCLDETNHAAAFNHLQHTRHNEDIEGRDIEYTQSLRTPQKSLGRKYQGKIGF